MRNLFTFLVIALLLFLGGSANAQKTWLDVYDIMHTNCSSETCHGSNAANESFNVDTTPQVLYARLINGTPLNPFEQTQTPYKLIVPGNAQQSYVLRKLAHCTSGSLELWVPIEGLPMPGSDSLLPPLPDSEIELIYQWIVQGADSAAVISPDTVAGDVCDIFVSIGPSPASEVSFSVFPNPVSKEFSVSYSVKTSAPVSIEVLDSKGLRTKVLENNHKAAGNYRQSFDADLPKGIYFIRLTIDGEQYLRKMVVL